MPLASRPSPGPGSPWLCPSRSNGLHLLIICVDLVVWVLWDGGDPGLHCEPGHEGHTMSSAASVSDLWRWETPETGARSKAFEGHQGPWAIAVVAVPDGPQGQRSPRGKWKLTLFTLPVSHGCFRNGYLFPQMALKFSHERTSSTIVSPFPSSQTGNLIG